jgi:hypothetical protein
MKFDFSFIKSKYRSGRKQTKTTRVKMFSVDYPIEFPYRNTWSSLGDKIRSMVDWTEMTLPLSIQSKY